MKDLPLTDEMVDYIDNLIKDRLDAMVNTRVRESFSSMLSNEVSCVTFQNGNIVFSMFDGSTVYKPFYRE